MELIHTELKNPAYNNPVRLSKWNGPVTVLSCHCIKTAAKLVNRLMPGLTKYQHAAIAKYHEQRVSKLASIWSKVADRATLETFGRAWQFTDYKICAIGRSEFSQAHKRVLRHCAYKSTKHRHLAIVHAMLAR